MYFRFSAALAVEGFKEEVEEVGRGALVVRNGGVLQRLVRKGV